MNETECKARVRQELLAGYYEKTGTLLIPVSVSNRHVHLDAQALSVLFGEGYTLTPQKDLVQLGQYACKETVTVRGPKGALNKVRILGPLRKETQIEISRTDSFTLGIAPVLRMSGELSGTPGVVIEGPAGSLELSRGVMIAMRHLHVPTAQGPVFGLKNGDTVSIVTTGERPSVLMQVAVRVSDGALLEAHVDTDEANACGIRNDMLCRIVKEGPAAQ